ncbi:MAG: hypothetical protein LLF95_12260 [Bacteroidales bacterium]|nr:hypothetical protein [Bacteroidales bacterium]
MRKVFVCLLLSVFMFSLQAQDKIITTNKDTIFCKIVTLSATQIFYEQTEDAKIAGKSIALDEVAGYFREPQPASVYQPQSNNSIVTERTAIAPTKPWILELSAGGSNMPWLLANIADDEMEDAYQQLKKGIYMNASAHYLLSDLIGVGLQYSLLGSGYKGSNFQVLDPSYPIYIASNSKVRQYINYAGPSVLFQQYLDQQRKLKLTETLSGGVLTYRIEEQFSMDVPSPSYYYTNSYNILASGTTYGGRFGLSAEYFVLPYLSVGVGGSFLYSRLSTLTMEYHSEGNVEESSNQELDNPLKLSRIDYSLVLRFHL